MRTHFTPVWNGQTPFYEIWFLVVFDHDGRALWLRYTTFAPSRGDARATLWGVFFDTKDEPPRFLGKEIFGIDAYRTAPDGGSVSIGDASLSLTDARGQITTPAARLGWELGFSVRPAPAPRLPQVLEHLPTPTKGHGLLFDAPCEGTLELDGTRLQLSGRGVLMHIHGSRRVDRLTWMAACSPASGTASFELTSVQPVAPGHGVALPALTTMILEADGDAPVVRTSLAAALGNRVSAPRPGLVIAEARTPRTRLVARGVADPRTLAGFAYRDPGGGHDVFVAQSDVATLHVEHYARPFPLAPWHPVAQRSFHHAAIEHHGRAPVPGVPTIAWDETHVDRPGPLASPGVQSEVSASEHVAWPVVRSIVALGLTYRDHIEETGGDAESADSSVVFTKDLRTLLITGDEVRIPSSEEMHTALEAIEPGLGEVLRKRYPFLPALMDYEVELGVVILGDGDYGFFLANDLTARACQILGEGRPGTLKYWAVAKSFPGFCPVTASIWRPGSAGLPEIEIVTRVNGEVRQRGSTRDLVHSLPRICELAQGCLGRPLAPGDTLLTGTPSGVALRIPAWKRRLGEALLDRFGKLDAAISMAVDSGRLLGPGDLVEISAGPLGTRSVVLTAP